PSPSTPLPMGEEKFQAKQKEKAPRRLPPCSISLRGVRRNQISLSTVPLEGLSVKTASRGNTTVISAPRCGSVKFGLLKVSKEITLSRNFTRVRTIEPRNVVSSTRPRK